MTAATKVKYGQVDDTIVASNLYRQAIINGNFDIWQRGTSVALADATATYLADRWFVYADKNTGTAPTLTLSRQLLTSGDINKSFYFQRIATNGAGTSYGTNAYAFTSQTIENGTRYLCGASKSVTISFWATSSIASKKLGLYLEQSYGTGGSPSAMEGIVGTTFTLTSSWVKYTATFTTNTLVGKTFGTNNDDNLKVHFAYVMGSGLSATRNGTTIANWEGSGNIDIAQVQLCAGDVALPFMPKSYEEELRACKRYCHVITTDASNPYLTVGFGQCTSTTDARIPFTFPVEMRTYATLTVTAGDWVLTDGVANQTVTSLTKEASTDSKLYMILAVSVASGLTAYRPCKIYVNNLTSKSIIASAEL